MSNNLSPASWGIVGGMGPLASAEFVRTIYEMSAGDTEQTAPHILLLSDPSFPDRTHALANGDQRELVKRLSVALTNMMVQGADAVIVCCVTIHSVFDQLPEELRQLLVPLTDVILNNVRHNERRHLLLCTTGCREAKIFERHPLWSTTRGRVVFPLREEDQEAVHELIYAIKRDRWQPRDAESFIRNLMQKYDCKVAIAGCTELHLVAKRCSESLQLFDPLMELAAQIASNQSIYLKGQALCAD